MASLKTYSVENNGVNARRKNSSTTPNARVVACETLLGAVDDTTRRVLFEPLSMLFNSYEFLFLFLPLTLGVCFYLASAWNPLLPRYWLLLASLIFYSWWNTRDLPVLIVSVILNYTLGERMTRLAMAQGSLGRRRRLLALAIALNLAILGTFKYGGPLGHGLPLGISFFTFTQIAFLVDAYRGDAKDYRFVDYALFVTFFPHLMAGPIIYHKAIVPQLEANGFGRPSSANLALGSFLFTIGLFKKVILADTLAAWANAGFSKVDTLNFVEAWTTLSCYSLQLYFDFSGYTDMAIAGAQMFNVAFPSNFHSPYCATNIRDFWRRWHMTLSAFLKHYVYIPLGGSRNGAWRVAAAIVATFFLGGLWHGAGWTFVTWGLLNAAAVLVYDGWRRTKVRMPSLLAWSITFLFINIAWVFFRARSFSEALALLRALVGYNGIVLPAPFARFIPSESPSLTYEPNVSAVLGHIGGSIYTFLWVLGGLMLALTVRDVDDLAKRFTTTWVSAILTGLLAAVTILSMTQPTQFLYFRF